MSIIKKYKKRSIGILVVLLILFSFIYTPALLFYDFGSGFDDFNSDFNNPLPATDNYLFKNRTYMFNLDDFYDDANLYKTYTGAKFQTEDFNETIFEWSGTISNDTVTPVDNDEVEYGSPSGHYPATYSFEEFADGTEGYDITGFVDWYSAGTDTSARIVSGIDYHEKIIELDDQSAAGYVALYHHFDYTEVNSIIEFWLASTSVSGYRNLYIYLYDQDNANTIRLCLTNNVLQYDSGGGDTTVYTFTANTFFNIKLVLDDTADTYDIYVNNDLKESNIVYRVSSTSNLYKLYFATRSSNTGYKIYIDAVGYSGDPEYTPSEQHAGTYSFTNILDGTEGLDIDFIDYYSASDDCYAKVIEEKFGHNKVLEVYDNNSTGSLTLKHYYDTIQTDSTVEFWWAYNGTLTYQHYLNMMYYEGGSERVRIIFGYTGIGQIMSHDGGGYVSIVTDLPINTFYHIKIIFDDSANTFDFYIDEVDKGTFDYKSNSAVGVDSVVIVTRTSGDEYAHWLDAFGFSFDPYYTIGDNLYASTGNVYPDNIIMISGSYDYTDNMKVNDDSSTNFTSTHTDGYIHEMPHQWDNFTFTEGTGGTIGEIETIDADYSTLISTHCVAVPDEFIDSITYTFAVDAGGTIENTHTDDGNSKDITSRYSVGEGKQRIVITLNFDPVVGGRDFYISAHIESLDTPGHIYINDILWKSGNDIDFDDNFHAGVNSIKYYTTWFVDWHGAEIYYFKIVEDETPVPALLDVQVDIQVVNPDCSSIEFFKYSHKTNVSVDVDLDIWNWVSETWYEIESVDNSATFDDDSFTLGSGSDYVSGTNQVRIRFQASSDIDDYELQIDRLRLDYLTPPAELEMTITFPFTNYNEDLLAMNVQSWQRTNKTQTITFKIWNYDTETWVQISSSSDTSFTKKEYNTESPANFISSSGVVKLNWTGSDALNDFELHIDYLFIQIFYKLNLVHSKSFNINGIFRYRWCVLGSVYYTQWVVFEVVDPEPNFHAISESDMTTRWILQGSDISPVENFTDDIAPSSDWDLYDVSPDNFNIYVPELENYLLDHITFYGSSYISPAQWGDFSFTKGAGNTVGELETDNDANYAIVDAGATYSGEALLDYIVPNGDILTNWNEADDPPHYLKLDEAKGDMNGDGGNIRETTIGVDDKWNFDSETLSAGHVVTKIEVYFYMKQADPIQGTIIKYTTSTGQSSTIVGTTSYSWQSNTHTGLSLSQTDLNAFWINVEPYSLEAPSGWVDIETVYVDIYTSLRQYSVDYTITWDVVDPESIENFEYDYRTTLAIDCDLDVYNWDTTGWLELESNTDVNWHTDSYVLTDPYISLSDEIKIRFQSASITTNFDMELDMVVLVYDSIYTISKKHNNTIPGYVYMQTNITELVSLNSSVYGANYTLSSGDYFLIDFQTSSDSQINLVLLRDGIVNETLILSQSGNTNFNRHTVKISVTETVEFDQLRFSSTFEDTDYLRCYDIKTYKYTLTGDSADFRVGSKNDYEVYLTPDDYNLRIHDPHDGDVKINTNITISSGYNFYIYEPTETIECRLALFSTQDIPLTFTDYHIKINRSLNGEYNEFSLLDNIFYADIETYVYIKVYDRFNALINSFERLASDYIDLEIEVYSLQIKNLQTQKTTVDINTTHVYPLLSEESIYFMLAKDYYQIGYYDTNDVYKQFLIYLDSNQAYELNRSKICFLAYVNQKGEHLFFNDYKTYINDSLIYENIFYREIGDDIGIEVKDIYGISIKNQSYTVVSGDNYIPVVLTMYSLKVMNQQEQFNHINITRDPNYYESGYYWSEWIAPNEIIKFRLFPGYYKINLTDNEGGSYSFYSYTLNGDDILLISSDNILSQVIYNIANVNTTIGNQITNVEINITNQNSQINNTIVNIEINLSNVNSTLGDLLTNIDVNILNLESDINSLYLFTNTSIWNLNSAMNNSFIYLENNIYSINQSISTLVIGIDNSVSLLNATIDLMFTEMNQQFITVQSTLNYSFSFLNQTIIQLANNITENHIVLYNLIEQRANDIDSSLIDVQTLINLVNNTVADESLVIQTLVNLIGANITNNHIIINNLLNLIDNNITNNNIQLVSILEVIGNNITTNHFVIQTLLDVIGNNITYNHIELLTNLNFINTTISQNQIELINRLLFINNTVNDLMFELTNQLLFLNGTIYSAVLNLSTSVEFGVDMVIGNITITYQQNEFLTELYKQTMFSQLLNWSGVAYNYTLMEDRIDAWTFVNNYINQSIEVHLRYQDLIEKLVVSADDSIEQYLPNEDVWYREWSVKDQKYLDEWKELDPKNISVDFGFYDEEVPDYPSFDDTAITIVLIILIFIGVISLTTYFAYKYNQRVQKLKRAYAMQHTIDKDLIEGVSRPRSSRMNKIK